MEKKAEITEDISKKILTTVPRQEEIVTKDIAEKEEKIAKSVVEIPPTTDELEKRKEKLVRIIKTKTNWIYGLILAFLVYIAVFIRTRNLPRLIDVSTGTWTLGPDLDPFLFLRWAKYIVANGSLMVVDMMRYVPIGHNTGSEMKLLAYLIAWFYKLLSFFSSQATVTYAAVLFPVIMFALTTLAFFLFARKIFYKENQKVRNIIALIATCFFILIPSLLPRTIAGIPEKESAAFFFLFIAFYLFLEAITSKKMTTSLIFAVLSGVSTALMALIWGGMIFVFFTVPAAFLLAFLFGKIDKQKFLVYSIWMFVSFILMSPFSRRYLIKNLIQSTSTGVAIGIFVLVGISLIIIKKNLFKEMRRKTKLPKELFSLIVSLIILIIIALIILGPIFFSHKIQDVKRSLISPQTTRWGLTVAENKQPYFATDWKNSFGPIVLNIPLFFWMFIIGSVVLFNELITKLKPKERLILTFSYFIFLIALIFSRYSPSSILDGISGLSLLVYFGGWLFFLFVFGYFYYKTYQKGDFLVFREFNFSYILYFIVLTLAIIGARGGIRLIMVLGAVSPIAIAFLVVKTSQKYLKTKEETMKFFIGVLAIILIFASLFTLWTYYNQDKITAANFAPSAYQWQWQKAMQWIREETPQDAVFAHWWDYGYWVQTLGERATILDGGNTIVYWNHLMGRHVLTGTDERTALEFLYTHNGTHLLIDSTDIGKYTAFSSIGADENYDRYSWIPTFLMDERQTQETNNQTIYVYPGGTAIDDDIIWELDGKEVFLPKKKAGIGALILTKTEELIAQPEAIFVYNNNQYKIPLRYVYYHGKLYDFESGLDAGVFLYPRIIAQQGGGIDVNEIGSAMYLSKRTIHSHLANLYLFDQESNYFKLAHTESSYMIDSLRNQGLEIGEFVYYGGFQGPIKIWNISYPSDIQKNPAYLEQVFPKDELWQVKPGEY